MKPVQVVPLTSQTQRLYPSEATLKMNGIKSNAMSDQLTTGSKLRLINCAGCISSGELRQFETCSRLPSVINIDDMTDHSNLRSSYVG